MNPQPSLPGCATPAPSRKARVYQHGHRWIVETPSQDGKPFTYVARSFRDAIRYLDRVVKFRRRRTV